MKAELITKKRGYKLVPISFSGKGLRQFPDYESAKPYLVEYIGVRPRRGRMMKDNYIQVLFKARRQTQVWHRDFFLIPNMKKDENTR